MPAPSKNFTSILDTAVAPDAPLDTALMTALRDNDIHLQEFGYFGFTAAQAHNHDGTNSALVASVANGAITQIKIASAAVGTAQLKTSIGAASAAGSTPSLLILPGGEYGFYPQIKVQDSSAGNSGFTIAGDMNASVFTNAQIGTSYITRVAVYNTRGTNDTSFAQQRYVTASPPWESYRAGDAIPRFVFALVEISTGKVVAGYEAEDPPWGNNGPTIINPLGRLIGLARSRISVNERDWRANPQLRAQYEDELDKAWTFLKDPKNALPIFVEMNRAFTQEEKNADMALIPHPFASFNPATHRVVVLNPTDDKFTRGLAMRSLLGDSVIEALMDGYFQIDNTPMPGLIAPASVMPVRARWKLTH